MLWDFHELKYLEVQICLYTQLHACSLYRYLFLVLEPKLYLQFHTVLCITLYCSSTGIGDPGLDIGSRIAINILPSDDAFGVFAFSPASLSVVVAEGGDSSGSLVSLTVTRSGGTFGDILVYWEVEGGVEVEEDISPRDGVVELAEGQSEGVIVVTIIDEMVRPLEIALRHRGESAGAIISLKSWLTLYTVFLHGPAEANWIT